MKVYYTQKQVVEGKQAIKGFESPSAKKPKQIAEVLQNIPSAIQTGYTELIEPNPLTREDFKLCHDPDYVDDVLDLVTENGFGTLDAEINESLFYTNGAMYDAVINATPDSPTCALVAGFHHAGYYGWRNLGYFCTFNGLMVSAMKFKEKVFIVDCDMHIGNGTEDIINKIKPDNVYHITFGKYFNSPRDARTYLEQLELNGFVYKSIVKAQPKVIIYQAGADVHVDDPHGGVLTTEQIYQRDKMMFTIAKELKIPLAWNLAGGYQIEKDGSIDKVIEIHLNTFKAANEVYGTVTTN